MNTLAWLLTLPAIQWLAVYAFETLTEVPLGLALEGVFVLALLMVIHEALNDWHELGRKREEG